MDISEVKVGATSCQVQQVWLFNFNEEMAKFEQLLIKYSSAILVVDTEFPGVVVHAAAPASTAPFAHAYATLVANVEVLRLIQVGMVLLQPDGSPLPEPGPTAWTFNLAFDKQRHVHAVDSIALLEKSGGVSAAQAYHGIDHATFARRMLTSGFLLSSSVTWAVWSGAWDMAYLARLFTGCPLPDKLDDFLSLCASLWPRLYDIKLVAGQQLPEDQRGSLQVVANALNISFSSQLHQAGVDAVLAGAVYRELAKQRGSAVLPATTLLGCLYGLCPTP